MPHQGEGQARLARAVGAHQGMHLADLHGQREAPAGSSSPRCSPRGRGSRARRSCASPSPVGVAADGRRALGVRHGDRAPDSGWSTAGRRPRRPARRLGQGGRAQRALSESCSRSKTSWTLQSWGRTQTSRLSGPGARHLEDRAVQGPHRVDQADLLGGAGEAVAAGVAARGGHDAGAPQRPDQLLDVRVRQLARLGDAGQRGGPAPSAWASATSTRIPYSARVDAS